MISINVTLFFIFTISLLWAYSNYFKRLAFVGNAVVALLSSFSILILGLYYHKQFETFLFFSVLSFLMSLIREIIKDMEDIKGDEQHGCKTLPIVIGIPKTKRIIYVILVALIGYFSIYQVTNYYLGHAINVLLGLVTSYFAFKLFSADKKNDFDHLSSVSKVILIVGVIAIIFASKNL